MTPRRIEQSLWIMTVLTTVLCALVMYQQRSALSVPHAPSVAPQVRGLSDVGSGSQPVIHSVEKLLATDLFRREHQTRYSPSTLPAVQAARPAISSKPRLVLQGVVGGPPWDAIIHGVPGHEESFVVRAGDSVGGLKIRSVRSDGATIRGMDTTWILKLGHTP